jgi:hypothetical protein
MNEVKIEGLKVWTSELRRTKQTAEGISAPAEHISALNELDAVSKCGQPQLCIWSSLSIPIAFYSMYIIFLPDLQFLSDMENCYKSEKMHVSYPYRLSFAQIKNIYLNASCYQKL